MQLARRAERAAAVPHPVEDGVGEGARRIRVVGYVGGHDCAAQVLREVTFSTPAIQNYKL